MQGGVAGCGLFSLKSDGLSTTLATLTHETQTSDMKKIKRTSRGHLVKVVRALRTLKESVRREGETIILPIHFCPSCTFQDRFGRGASGLEMVRDYLLEVLGGSEVLFEYTFHQELEVVDDPEEFNCDTVLAVEGVSWKYMGTEDEQEDVYFVE